jgi:hypothetical protein
MIVSNNTLVSLLEAKQKMRHVKGRQQPRDPARSNLSTSVAVRSDHPVQE